MFLTLTEGNVTFPDWYKSQHLSISDRNTNWFSSFSSKSHYKNTAPEEVTLEPVHGDCYFSVYIQPATVFHYFSLKMSSFLDLFRDRIQQNLNKILNRCEFSMVGRIEDVSYGLVMNCVKSYHISKSLTTWQLQVYVGRTGSLQRQDDTGEMKQANKKWGLFLQINKTIIHV